MFAACAAFMTPGGRASADDKVYTLAPKYTVGDLYKARLKSDVKMVVTTEDGRSPAPDGIPMLMTVYAKYRTARVDPSGTATLERTVTSGISSTMGQEKEIPAGTPVTMEYDRRGVRKLADGPGTAQGMELLAQLFDLSNMPTNDFYFPSHPVAIGETWETVLPGLLGEGKVKVASRLTGVDTLQGKEIFKVKQTVELPLDLMVGSAGPVKSVEEALIVVKGALQSTGDVLVDGATGRVVKMSSMVSGEMQTEYKGEMAQKQPLGSKLGITMTGKVEQLLVAIGPAADAPDPTPKTTSAGQKAPKTP